MERWGLHHQSLRGLRHWIPPGSLVPGRCRSTEASSRRSGALRRGTPSGMPGGSLFDSSEMRVSVEPRPGADEQLEKTEQKKDMKKNTCLCQESLFFFASVNRTRST